MPLSTFQANLSTPPLFGTSYSLHRRGEPGTEAIIVAANITLASVTVSPPLFPIGNEKRRVKRSCSSARKKGLGP